MTIRPVRERRHVDHAAVQMRCDDASRLGSQSGVEQADIELSVVVANINKNGSGAEVQDVREVGLEVISREDHLVTRTDAESAQGQFNGDCAAGAELDVRAAQSVDKDVSQPGTVGTVVASPIACCEKIRKGVIDFGLPSRPVRRSLRTDRLSAK